MQQYSEMQNPKLARKIPGGTNKGWAQRNELE